MRRPKVQVSSDDWVCFFYFIQRSALMIVPATDLIIQANFQGSMTLMLCFQEHANLIPLNKGYANLKSKFPVVIHSLSLKFLRLNYTVQYGKKSLAFIQKSSSHAMYYFYSLGFEFSFVFCHNYCYKLCTKYHCHRKVFFSNKAVLN